MAAIIVPFYTQEKKEIQKLVLLSSCRKAEVHLLFTEQILGELLCCPQ